MDDTLSLDEVLEELQSAEDFLEYFDVVYEPKVVQVNRLHILQRFHDYLARHGEPTGSDAARAEVYRRWLDQAYRDFVTSSPLQERVFRVLQTVPDGAGGHTAYVSLDRIFQPRT